MVMPPGRQVDLSEVEAVLRTSPDVRDVVVVTRSSAPEGPPQLVAYVVPAAGRLQQARQLRLFALERLPEPMVPSAFVTMPALPRGPSGKVDRLALPEPDQRLEDESGRQPSGEIENRLAAVWRGILKVQSLNATDSFFELGGDSLSVLAMMTEVEKEFGKPVPQSFFSEPTLRGLAALLQTPAETAAVGSGPRRGGGASRERSRFARTRRGLRAVSHRLTVVLPKVVDQAFVYEWFLSLRSRRLTYARAKQMMMGVPERGTALAIFYAGRARLFRRFAASLGLPDGQAPALFRECVRFNLLFKITEGQRPFRLRGSRLDLDRRRIVAEADLSELDEHFPVSGLEYLHAARAKGAGVLLVAYHGNAGDRAAKAALTRRLGGQSIHGVAHKTAALGTEFEGQRHLMPSGRAGTLYGQLAYQAQLQLKRGEVLHMVSDTFAPGPGSTYHIQIADRVYRVKAGFAELALNTGAAVLPICGRFLDDGRLLYEIFPPLEAGRAARDVQIQSLLDQYASFVTGALRRYPALTWKRMWNHLLRPVAGAALAGQEG